MATSFRPADEENPDDGVVAEINITPLTDVFLVLLIIFMVATSAAVQSASQVQLPKAKAENDPAAAITMSRRSLARMRWFMKHNLASTQ